MLKGGGRGYGRAAARTSCAREQAPGRLGQSRGTDELRAGTGAGEVRTELRHGRAARGNSCRGGYGWRRADVMIILEC